VELGVVLMVVRDVSVLGCLWLGRERDSLVDICQVCMACGYLFIINQIGSYP
jgi:hypothetical protein